MSDDLTSYNIQFLRPTKDGSADIRAINCTKGISERVREYVRESLAESTRIAYKSDLSHFDSWGGKIPATPEMVANYLAAFSDGLSIASLNRRLAALSKAHRARGLSTPTTDELVKATMRGLKRIKGVAQRQAQPLIKEDLILALEATGERLKDLRDRALLLLGFAGGFRRSELVGLNCADVEVVRQGIVIHLRSSKTDQNGEGRKIGIPHARGRWCPVAAVTQWLDRSGISEGAVFRPIDRHHHIGAAPLSGEAVCLIVKDRVRLAGFNPAGYSGHSLRAGLATSAAQAGVSSWKIRQQTGHASDAMLARYIRDGELFIANAAGALL